MFWSKQLNRIENKIDAVSKKLDLLINEGEWIMSTQAELAQQLTVLTEQVKKIGTETSTLIQKVADLTAALNAGGNVTPEVQAAMDALSAQVKVVDDLVPDAPAPN